MKSNKVVSKGRIRGDALCLPCSIVWLALIFEKNLSVPMVGTMKNQARLP